jgi:polar amino acid transport system permease protein
VGVVLVILVGLVRSAVTNPRFRWDIVGHYFLSSDVLHGLLVTLELTVIAMVVGIVLGVVLAVMRLSPNPILSLTAWGYTWFFRGTPVIVQLIFWGFIAQIYPRLSLGIPFGPGFVSADSNKVVTLFVAAVIGLGFNEGAYMSEIVRAGLLSVDHGQTEAAQALGMRRLQIMRRIVLPQAMRVIIPPTGNETISMLKTSSLVAFIGLQELLGTVQLIYGANFKQIPLLVVASLWYLIMTSVLSFAQYYIERHYARGSSRALPPTPVQRLRRWLTGLRPPTEPAATGPAAGSDAAAGGDPPDPGASAGGPAGTPRRDGPA